MKKILVSLSMVGMVALVAVGATRAFFSDTATSTGNTFTAGTLDLKVDGNDSANSKFAIANAKPGDSNVATADYLVLNNGSINGTLNFDTITVSQVAGTIASHSDPGVAHLSDHLTIVVKVNGVTYYSGALSGFAAFVAGTPLSYSLTSGSSTHVVITYSWPTSGTDNNAQGDVDTVGFNLTLTQS
jgi:spore coat-associated protein N